MALENARAMLQGIIILVLAAVAAWVSQSVGLVLLAVVGVLKLQETATDWCPSNLFLKPLGLKSNKAAKPKS